MPITALPSMKSSNSTVVEWGVPKTTAIWPGPVRLRNGVRGWSALKLTE